MGSGFTLTLLSVAVVLLALMLRRSAALRRGMVERLEEQTRLLALFEVSPLPTWVYEEHTGRFLEVNNAAIREYGYTAEEFAIRTVNDIRVSGAEAATEGVVRAIHRRKDGTSLEVEIHARPVRYRKQQARLAVVEDVTERLGAERALRESEAQFRAMFEASPVGVVLVSPNGSVQQANDTALRMLGLSLDQALGFGWVEAIHPDDRERLQIEWGAAAAARQSYSAAGRFARAELWWRARTSPVWSGDECLGHVAVIIDETEQRSAEDALRESEERFRQLAEHIPAVVYLAEPRTGSMLFISPAYEQIWGRTTGSLYASPWSFLDAVHDDDRERVRLAYQRRQARLVIKYRIVRPDGELVWIEDLQFPIRRADGGIYLVAGLAFDVTRRSRLEGQLIESQKMESLGRLAGGVAHDFNNLLTIILSYADLLKEQPGAPREMLAGLNEIEKAGLRASSLTRQLLTFAQRQVVSPKVLDLNELVVNIGPLLRHMVGDHIDVDVRPQASPATARLDASQIDQVVMDLASNARDAMPDGGSLRIETATVPGPTGTAVPAGDYVTLTVADTGTGIPADIREEIFEPFFTTKPSGQGTGLGLSTAYGIVTQLGGYIELNSQVGFGTEFICYFPLVRLDAVSVEADDSPQVSRPCTETVLLVEDEPAVLNVARATLERLGYQVLTAAHGVEGLQLTHQRGDSIDLVVTDVVMPEMGGWEMARQIRAERPGLKILFTSGYNEEIANVAGRVEDGVHLLPKPYLPTTLARRVRQMLDAG